MNTSIAIVYEAPRDFQTATELADRVLIEAVDWLDEHHLAHQREWVSSSETGTPLTWKAIKALAHEAGIKARGHFKGEPGLADAAAARRAIRYLRKTLPGLKAIVLVRDRDDQPSRRKGLDQARESEPREIVIVIGLAIVEREAWVISGFEAQNDDELSRLRQAGESLGFDPCERSHDLKDHKCESACRSAKRVMQLLVGSDCERESACWQRTALKVLRQRGQNNGLALYLQEVRERLAPLFGHVPRKSADC
jgi:hypothetical protein